MIGELKCSSCGIAVKGDFEICEFCRLPKEQHEFLRLYLRCEGNIRKIEKVLNISYPTVKARIEELLKSLKLSPIEDDTDVYDAIAQGKMTVDEAVEILKQKKK